MIRICHMSSVHQGLDVRIFSKECCSLAKAGYETHLVITATKEDVEKAAAYDVIVHPLSAGGGRLTRILRQAWSCYRKALSLRADIYQFHDPELIPYGILLRLSGKNVIYDVHEDLPRDILDKDWIPTLARRGVAVLAGALEFIGARWFFYVSAATPHITDRFRRVSGRVLNINNFPILGELSDANSAWDARSDQVCYVGGLSSIRGIRQLVQAMSLTKTDVKLELAGNFSELDLERDVRRAPGWERIKCNGFLDRGGVRDVLRRSIAGVVTFSPVPNHVNAQPNKMFEYMSAGIPVIASNFPLWREIIEGNDCGICVDPDDPADIADAIDAFVRDRALARRMGDNGRRAVEKRYNWQVEERKLVKLYETITSVPKP